MPSFFDAATYRGIVTRVDAIRPDSARQWGTMSPAQMLEHIARTLAMAAGKGPAKQLLLGKLLGWALRGAFLGPKPFGKNGPTGPDFIVKDEPDFATTKARTKAALEELYAMGERGCDGNMHAFFGRLTGPEWGIIQYKHLDHHLRQFGV